MIFLEKINQQINSIEFENVQNNLSILHNLIEKQKKRDEINDYNKSIIQKRILDINESYFKELYRKYTGNEDEIKYNIKILIPDEIKMNLKKLDKIILIKEEDFGNIINYKLINQYINSSSPEEKNEIFSKNRNKFVKICKKIIGKEELYEEKMMNINMPLIKYFFQCKVDLNKQKFFILDKEKFKIIYPEAKDINTYYFKYNGKSYIFLEDETIIEIIRDNNYFQSGLWKLEEYNISELEILKYIKSEININKKSFDIIYNNEIKNNNQSSNLVYNNEINNNNQPLNLYNNEIKNNNQPLNLIYNNEINNKESIYNEIKNFYIIDSNYIIKRLYFLEKKNNYFSEINIKPQFENINLENKLYNYPINFENLEENKYKTILKFLSKKNNHFQNIPIVEIFYFKLSNTSQRIGIMNKVNNNYIVYIYSINNYIIYEDKYLFKFALYFKDKKCMEEEIKLLKFEGTEIYKDNYLKRQKDAEKKMKN